MPIESPLRQQHQALGANMEPYFDCLLPGHYADLAVECKTARESAALFDTNYHAIAAFNGPDRVRYLNAVLTSDVKGLAYGHGWLGRL
ncbi:MAG: hypothetical protein M1453_13835, partial [Acidobacteria bacterium]|nr:hypothetical protein [Acidobacteriota bacterium]